VRAVVIHARGGPEVLQEAEVPDPDPAQGEILVQVRACALNHLDLWTRRGQAGGEARLPHILGSDIAGEIRAMDRPHKGLRLGQRVMLSPGTSCGRCRACLGGEDNACRDYRILGCEVPGGYAELVRCPAQNAIGLPDNIDFEEAAAFPLVFLTAWHMLVRRARLRSGETVLVWAAGSGVAMGAIQIARALGARVFTTAGNDEKVELARQLGPEAVFNHHTTDVVAEVKRLTNRAGVDVVVEHVGEATWERSIKLLAHGGRLVTCGATTGPKGVTELRYLFSKRLSLLGSFMGSKADLLDASLLLFAGKVRSLVHEVLPLSAAREAHAMMEASAHFGKIVLRV